MEARFHGEFHGDSIFPVKNPFSFSAMIRIDLNFELWQKKSFIEIINSSIASLMSFDPENINRYN